jgi:hypothetical protein
LEVGRVKKLVKTSLVAALAAVLSLSAVPALAQVDEWQVLENARGRSGVYVEAYQITGNVDSVQFQVGYTRTTGYFRYAAEVYCDDGQSWSESGRARDTRNRYWRSRIFDLSNVPTNVPCYASIDVSAVRGMRGWVMYGAIWGHFYE